MHMIEIRRAAFKRKYGLSDLQAEDRVETAKQIVETAGGVSTISSHMDTGDLMDVLQAPLKAATVRLRIGVNEPDYFCFLGFAYITILHVQRGSPDAEKVDFVVSRKDKVTDNLKYFHSDLRRFMEERDTTLSGMIGELIPGEMENRLPLKAADMFCWNIRQRYQEGTEQKYKCFAHRWTREGLGRLAVSFLSAADAQPGDAVPR